MKGLIHQEDINNNSYTKLVKDYFGQIDVGPRGTS